MSLFLARLKLRHPHSPCDSVSLRYIDTVIATFVVFTTLIFVSLPFSGESCLFAQGSPPGVEVGGSVGARVTARVGGSSGVSVTAGVCVGVSVGGRGAFFGIA